MLGERNLLMAPDGERSYGIATTSLKAEGNVEYTEDKDSTSKMRIPSANPLLFRLEKLFAR